jgi:uncharacterized phosphosugar-binding protein
MLQLEEHRINESEKLQAAAALVAHAANAGTSLSLFLVQCTGDRTIAAGVHLRHGGNEPRQPVKDRHLNMPRRRGTEAQTSSVCFRSERKKTPRE